MLGFLKEFPGDLIGYFSSGTGFAGIFGAGSLLIFKAIGLKDYLIYLLAAPTLIPYFLCFYWMDNRRNQYPFVQEEKANDDEDG